MKSSVWRGGVSLPSFGAQREEGNLRRAGWDNTLDHAEMPGVGGQEQFLLLLARIFLLFNMMVLLPRARRGA